MFQVQVLDLKASVSPGFVEGLPQESVPYGSLQAADEAAPTLALADSDSRPAMFCSASAPPWKPETESSAQQQEAFTGP